MTDYDSGMVFGRACEGCGFDQSVIWFEPIDDDPAGGTSCSECGTVYGLDGTRDRARTEARRTTGVEPPRSFSGIRATSRPDD
ncbi:hypothetical protein [Curtobacterium sp. VKM Ac-1393]|uniref:hypothetical protein n=1 Tax=Curtobacterium sp. VKM Ac-1393 TaxID=2783814 RepID=UPI00188BFE1B|nr:hypothetical protein [Curtobacterium sp. VKM Ac-1393]MBF4609375.1 hypothetical protein [Curtobacterium sp. VKM Ac-1393]